MPLRIIDQQGDNGDDRGAEQVGRLFDYAVDHPDGFTNLDILADLGWSRSAFVGIVRQFRSVFSTDDVTLPCDPDPANPGGPWVYKLSGDTIAWHTNRLLDTETRLETIHNVALSAMHALDGRTSLGKRARLIERVVRHLQEDLAEIRRDGTG